VRDGRAADLLSQSVANNVTSEMGLALLDVADVVRRHPAALEHLRQAGGESLLTDLAGLEGGDVVGRSIQEFLNRYGMRCPGEIDITRPRWSERPADLVPIIIGNIKNFEPDAHDTLFKRGLRDAEEKERDFLNRLEWLRRTAEGQEDAADDRRVAQLRRVSRRTC
jgi:pyruvate,water dikinase